MYWNVFNTLPTNKQEQRILGFKQTVLRYGQPTCLLIPEEQMLASGYCTLDSSLGWEVGQFFHQI